MDYAQWYSVLADTIFFFRHVSRDNMPVDLDW